MDVLVTGMHRSGTSVMACLIAAGCKKSILDDPEWAIENPKNYKMQQQIKLLSDFSVVKCPRFSAFLCDIMSIFHNTKVVVMIRDPRDITASIYEKISLNRPTRMLAFPELNISQNGLDSFVTAYSHYLLELREACELFPKNIFVVSYEKFYRNRTLYVSLIADKMNWDINQEIVLLLSKYQLGPLGHKKNVTGSTIRGPGRYLNDLSEEIILSIEDAIQAWQYTLNAPAILNALLSI